jgi:hypothetical protein
MSSPLELLIMHHENMRILYPDAELMILCECDGTVYDRRALTLHVLRSFDTAHETTFFKKVTVGQLPNTLPDIYELLHLLDIPYGISRDIALWYSRNLWDIAAVRQAHSTLANVIKVLTCLQMQERTHIGLCAERAGRSDEEFVTLINTLGSSAGLHIDRTGIFLDDDAAARASERVIRAWRHFQSHEYRLITIIDNRVEAEPAHIFSIDTSMEVLVLQAHAVREMARLDMHPRQPGSPACVPRDMLKAYRRGRILPGSMHARAGAAMVEQAAS